VSVETAMEHDGAGGDIRRDEGDETPYPFDPLVHERLADEGC